MFGFSVQYLIWTATLSIIMWTVWANSCCDEEIIFLVFVQGHYRYCEALFSLGHYEMAIKANKLAQMLCKDDHEGVKDLETQFCKYTTTHPMAHPGPPRGYVSGKLKNPVFLQWLMVKGYFFFCFVVECFHFLPSN